MLVVGWVLPQDLARIRMALQCCFGFRRLVFLFHFPVTTAVPVYRTPALCFLLCIHSFNMRDSPAGIVTPPLTRAETGVPERVRDLCEVLGPRSSSTCVHSRVCLPVRAARSPPPAASTGRPPRITD